MSASKLKKYLGRPVARNAELSKKPILIATSKGTYIKKHRDLASVLGCEVDFVCQPGARFPDFYVA